MKDGDTPKMNTSLHVAVSNGQWKKVAKLINTQGVDVNARNADGETPLHIAAWKPTLATLKELLKAPGLELNARSNDGRTPLHHAAYNGGHVKELLEMPGIDVNAQVYGTGESALHFAAMINDELTTRDLLSHPDIDVNTSASDGMTALDIAMQASSLVYLLCKAGAVVKDV